MKLKRFLLRYDPPGIGLEVEDDGKISVQHRDLPPHGEVTSAKDVQTTVDGLLESEPGLLTRKRHRAALFQLMARLYQQEVDAESDADDPDGGGPGRGSGDEVEADGKAGGDASGDSFQEGQNVVLRLLTGKQQVYNGEVVTVVKAKADKQKYEVDLKGETIKVKGIEHLLPVSGKDHLASGSKVAIRGLRNHIELNGCIALVEECHDDAQRYEVRAAPSGQLFRVKRENLVPVEGPAAAEAVSSLKGLKENREPNAGAAPRKKEGGLPAAVGEAALSGGGESGGETALEVGSTVELTGLKTAQAYNGQQAEVLSVDRVRSRYEIRLGDGSVKTIRAENVRLVQGKSPRSKRQKDKS